MLYCLQKKRIGIALVSDYYSEELKILKKYNEYSFTVAIFEKLEEIFHVHFLTEDVLFLSIQILCSKFIGISDVDVTLSQVKKYMEVILSISEFNASNMTWQFYLVGNRFSQNGFIQREIQNNKHHGEDSLVFSVDNYKIYVKHGVRFFLIFKLGMTT